MSLVRSAASVVVSGFGGGGGLVVVGGGGFRACRVPATPVVRANAVLVHSLRDKYFAHTGSFGDPMVLG